MQIDIAYDSSVTNLRTSNPTLYNNFTGAVQAAVQVFDSIITNPITVTINFGFGEIDGNKLDPGNVGQSLAFTQTVPYATLLNALEGADNTSPVQRAAAATLPASVGGTWQVNTAEEEALGLSGPNAGATGWVGLGSDVNYSWSHSNVVPGTTDAVGVLEHEISEVLGRHANGGVNGNQTNIYQPLDLFRYTAANALSNDPTGSPVGVRDEPFMSNYNPTAFSYFSFDGATVSLPFDSPKGVAAGGDVADWGGPVPNDSFDDITVSGTSNIVSLADLQAMNVLGYDFGNVTAQVTALAPPVMVSAGTSLASVVSAAATTFDTSTGPLSVVNAARNFHSMPDNTSSGHLAFDPISGNPAISPIWPT